MDDCSVGTSPLPVSDTSCNTTSFPYAASVTDADKVINTQIDSTQVEGDKSKDELLKSLLADDYCHLCNAVLLFESQRLSHYEGKKHAQKIKLFLQAKKAEKMKKQPPELQLAMPADKDRFCDLCNMVFSSHVVAKSHYEGKVHLNNLRKKGSQAKAADGNTAGSTLQNPTGDSDNAQRKTAAADVMDQLPSAALTTTTPRKDVDLKDPNKYCNLCAAAFNNPQMAFQHYNGRKHQRNISRQELLQDLGSNDQQEKSLVCQICSLQFNSVEMYQAHMQGNKHQIREKNVIDLCKSQQKNYSTFADELSDYIQVQKARGIAPKTSQVISSRETQKEEDKDDGHEVFNKGGILKLRTPVLNPTLAPHSPHRYALGCSNPVEWWCPPYQSPPLSYHGLHKNSLPPVFPGQSSKQFPGFPLIRKKCQKPSHSSSNDSSSSYTSSYSSSTSDGDEREYRQQGKGRIKRSRTERNKRARDEYSENEDKGGNERGRKGIWSQKRGQERNLEERRTRGEGKKEEIMEGGENHIWNPRWRTLKGGK